MLYYFFSFWYDINKVRNVDPRVQAAIWAGGIMAAFIIVGITPVGEAFFRWTQGCRRPTRKEEETLKPIFEDVCRAARVSPVNYSLFVQDGKFPNAFAMGWSTVCVSRGLLSSASEDDIKGVLAHEMGHHAYRDSVWSIAYYMITVVGQIFRRFGVIIVAILAFLPRIAGREGSREREYAGIFTIFALILAVLMRLFDFFVWGPIQLGNLFGSRQKEFRADRFAAKIGYGEELKSFLNVIIDIDGKPDGFMGLLYSSHPKTGDRIRRLEDFADMPQMSEASAETAPQPSPFAAFEEDEDEETIAPQPMALRTPSPVFAAAAARIASLKTGVLGLFKPRREKLDPQPQSPISSFAVTEAAHEAIVGTRETTRQPGVSVTADLSESADVSWFVRFLPFICAALLCLAEYFWGRYLIRNHAEVFYKRITFWNGILRLIVAVIALPCLGYELIYPTPDDERDWSFRIIMAGSALSLASCANILLSSFMLKMKYIVYIHVGFLGKTGYFNGLDFLFALGAIMIAGGFIRRHD